MTSNSMTKTARKTRIVAKSKARSSSNLVDVSAVTQWAGIQIPIALTAAAWDACMGASTAKDIKALPKRDHSRLVNLMLAIATPTGVVLETSKTELFVTFNRNGWSRRSRGNAVELMLRLSKDGRGRNVGTVSLRSAP